MNEAATEHDGSAHTAIMPVSLWCLHQEAISVHLHDLWQSGNDDICLAIANLRFIPCSFFFLLENIAWVQTRQEEHLILQSFNNLWMADYKLM